MHKRPNEKLWNRLENKTRNSVRFLAPWHWGFIQFRRAGPVDQSYFVDWDGRPVALVLPSFVDSDDPALLRTWFPYALHHYYKHWIYLHYQKFGCKRNCQSPLINFASSYQIYIEFANDFSFNWKLTYWIASD